jgi:lytic murein transglycosylase
MARMHVAVLPHPRSRRPLLGALMLASLLGCASAPSTPQRAASASAPAPASAPAAASAPVPAEAASSATDEAAIEDRFAQWVAGFRESARAAGIDDATLAATLDGARYVPRVVELDQAQPEFTRSVWSYLDGLLTPQRIAQGQDALSRVRPEADAAAARYGVPPSLLVAIWGIESNFGANYGDIPTIDALATLGFEGRRESWARGELLAALRIVQHGDIDRAHMIGSWAGAMGQTQLLPSNYLAYAVDADGDGRRDIWSSMADVLATTANFVARSGWRPGEPWGVEVRLPPGFDPGRADDSIRQSATQWAIEGVQAMDGTPLPPMTDAAILLPAGQRGPAFMVGAGFRAILRYNNSTSYALAVGLLSQRLDGGPGVQAAWPRDLVPLARSQVRALQDALNQHGFDCGAADGMVGPATRRALRDWQRSVGLPADGYPTLDLLQRLQAP